MDTLLFIRHAETDLKGRFCGRSDPPVNERGFHAIAELLKTLKNETIDSVYSSDLSRAVTTANAIGQAFGLLPVAVLPDLREMNFGEWEGLSWAEIESRDRVYARRWRETYPDLPAPGGEPFEAFESRVLRQMSYLLAVSSQKCGAVVTHAGVMRVVLHSLCGLDEKAAWEWTKEYCGFFRYERGGSCERGLSARCAH